MASGRRRMMASDGSNDNRGHFTSEPRPLPPQTGATQQGDLSYGGFLLVRQRAEQGRIPALKSTIGGLRDRKGVRIAERPLEANFGSEKPCRPGRCWLPLTHAHRPLTTERPICQQDTIFERTFLEKQSAQFAGKTQVLKERFLRNGMNGRVRQTSGYTSNTHWIPQSRFLADAAKLTTIRPGTQLLRFHFQSFGDTLNRRPGRKPVSAFNAAQLSVYPPSRPRTHLSLTQTE